MVILFVHMFSADNPCKQFGPRSGKNSVRPDLAPNMLTLMVFLEKKVDFKKNNQQTTAKAYKITQQANN